MRILVNLLSGAALLAAAFAAHSQGEDVEAIRALVRQGQHEAALTRLDAALSTRPDDPNLRFLKGVVLAERSQLSAALEVFEGLTKDFPELPEPHNNLAVLHAAQGNYDRARDALLIAINTHPSYATAHENLGDIYAKMAGLAYDRALELDTSNRSAQSKLSLIDDLFSQRLAAMSTPAPVLASPAPAPARAPEPKPVEPVAATSPPAPPPPAPPPAEEANPATVQEVLDSVYAWARAWSAQDVDRYLSAYGPGFKPPKGQGRRQWERKRRDRLSRPRFIEVELSDVGVEMRGVDRARVTFSQSYRSDTYSDSVRKRLDMAWTGADWAIVGERSVP